MISEKMKKLSAGKSAIRAMFEDGKKLAAQYGAENVYDFSLGNPNVPAPQAVRDAIVDIASNEDSVFLHGYMSNSGYESVRECVASSLNKEHGTHFKTENILMTVGAAGGLNVILKTLLNPGDEVLAFAPYFAEYGNYVLNYDGVLVAVSPNTKTFQPNLEEFEKKLTARTKTVIVNTPNNPTGVIYSEQTIQAIAAILEKKQAEYGTSIYLISDEPYRELAFDGIKVPYLTKYYRNTVVCYSWSKSLSLPGERIGYLVLPSEMDDAQDIIDAAAIANRVSGFVNAPSLMQLVVARCIEEKTDIAVYNRNREALYKMLRTLGFECIKPEGAFYMFVKSPIPDEKQFVAKAKELRLLLVPGSSFACPGFVRIAYCVSYDTIIRSEPSFRELAAFYGLT